MSFASALRPLLVLLTLASFGGCVSQDDGAAPSGEHRDDPSPSTPPAPVAPQPTNGIIACFYDEARTAGAAVLQEGGSAADAFVAITLVNYVRAAGETSLGGPLGAMTYEAASGKVAFLDATFDSMRDPSGRYDPAQPKIGASVLVPGALRGLEEIWKAKGKLPWARLVEPAKKLAAEGYRADALLVGAIKSRKYVLERSAYAKALYLPDGAPIHEGTVLKQPELAAFLDDVAKSGSHAMYEDGEWSASFVTQVNAAGGRAAAEDLSSYRATWQEPWTLDVSRGGVAKRVFASSGRSYGGVYDLVGLSVLAHDTRDDEAMSDADRLEVRLRTARALYEDPWFYEATKLDDAAFVAKRVNDTAALWAKVAAAMPASPRAAKGSHSLQVTVIDRNGDAITGTNTINSLPWGSGIFVRGVSLTDAGTTTMFVPGPGERVVNPLTLHVVVNTSPADHSLAFLGGSFGSSLLETQLQIVADAVFGDAKLSAAQITERPRFGTFPFDFELGGGGATSDLSANWLDTGASKDLVAELLRRGLKVKQDPRGDTGWGTFLFRDRSSGVLGGATLDASWFRGGVTTM